MRLPDLTDVRRSATILPVKLIASDPGEPYRVGVSWFTYPSSKYDLDSRALAKWLATLMTTVPPSTPRRGTQRASHLRKISNGSPVSNHNVRPSTRASDAG